MTAPGACPILAGRTGGNKTGQTTTFGVQDAASIVSQLRNHFMNRTVDRTLRGICALLLALPFCAAAAGDDAAELEEVRERVSEAFEEIRPEHVQPSPVDGWYTIRKGAIVAYISSDGRYLLQGDLIDMEAEVNLSEQSRNAARLDMLSEIPEEKMIVFSPDEPRYSIAVFTDIDCTYCRRLHSQIDEYLAQGIEIRYLLYPRNGPDTGSWEKAEDVWCADDRNRALTLAKLEQKFQTESCDASIVQTHFDLGQDVGLQGTPAIVLEDGTMISGYLPPLDLAQALAATQSAAGR